MPARFVFIVPWLLLAFAAHAHDCTINGVEVNPDNGSTLEGKTGILRCNRPGGRLWSEQELVDGKYLGLERFHDEDGSIRERKVNAHGNTQGTKREFYPNGKLRSQAEYDNGSEVGRAVKYHPSGDIAGLWFYPKAGEQAVASIEYDAAGRVRWLRCHTESLLAEDKTLCGHDGHASMVTLHSQRGEPRERAHYQRGVLLEQEELDADGKVSARVKYEKTRRIEQEFHPSGQMKHERIVNADESVEEKQWYMNGKPSQTKQRRRDGNIWITRTEFFRDDGTRQSVDVRSADGRPIGTEQIFDEQGRLKEERDYDSQGVLSERRAYEPDGRLREKTGYYPDGSRRAE